MKSIFDDELQHHGILGQRWGVRRFQNEDGSLTPAGERRYNSNGSGAAKPNGARNPTYTLNSGKAYRRGKGLGTGPVGTGNGRAGSTSGGGGGSSSGTQGAGRDPEPQPIGSDEWWKWYENTNNREVAEKHYDMVTAEEPPFASNAWFEWYDKKRELYQNTGDREALSKLERDFTKAKETNLNKNSRQNERRADSKRRQAEVQAKKDSRKTSHKADMNKRLQAADVAKAKATKILSNAKKQATSAIDTIAVAGETFLKYDLKLNIGKKRG